MGGGISFDVPDHTLYSGFRPSDISFGDSGKTGAGPITTAGCIDVIENDGFLSRKKRHMASSLASFDAEYMAYPMLSSGKWSIPVAIKFSANVLRSFSVNT